ncbi:MAG: hypothetical protein M3169_01625 [Candidatus Eremiobacteraeota bacterium]|nr:hypothetical protein [Candidatus Eremiobacteraeota bacterium]
MRMPAVHYGSLAIPRAAQALVDGALAYLRRDAVERSLIRRVEHSGAPHRIVINHRGDDSYQPDTHTIRWDPTSAMRTTGHGRQSPALGLGHELDHAALSDRAFDLLVAVPDRRFDNLEERRVILGSERHAARTLHEGTRDDHRGRLYRVATPIDR